MSQINTTLFSLTADIDGLVKAAGGVEKLFDNLTTTAEQAGKNINKITNIIGTETDAVGTRLLDTSLRRIELAADKYKKVLLEMRTGEDGNRLLQVTESADLKAQQRDEEKFSEWQFRTKQRLTKLVQDEEEKKQKAIAKATEATLKGATEVKEQEEKRIRSKIKIWDQMYAEIDKKEQKALAEGNAREADRLKNVKLSLKNQTEVYQKHLDDRKKYENTWSKLLDKREKEEIKVAKAATKATEATLKGATEVKEQEEKRIRSKIKIWDQMYAEIDKKEQKALAEGNAREADRLKNVKLSLKNQTEVYQKHLDDRKKYENTWSKLLDKREKEEIKVAKAITKTQAALAGETIASKIESSSSPKSGMFNLLGTKAATAQGQANIQAAKASLQSIAETGRITQDRLNQLFNSFNKGTTSALGPLNSLERRSLKAMFNLQQAVKTADEAGLRTQELLITPRGALRIVAVQQFHRMVSTVVNALAQAEEQAKKFDIKIAEIQTITQKASSSTKEWSNALLELSGRFGFDNLDVANAAYEAVSNQIAEGIEVTYFLSDAFSFARATSSSAEQSVNLLSSVLNAYNLEATEAAKVSGILFKLIDLGRVRAGDLANTFGNTAILASQMGISLEELSAGMATLTVQGVQHNTAMTLMNNIILKLLKPSEAMKELFNQWGVASGEAAIQTFGFEGVLKRLDKELETGGLSRIADLEKDLRAIRATAGLTGSAFDKFSDSLNEIRKSQSEYDKAVELTSRNLGARLEQEEAKIQALMIEVSTAIQTAKLEFYEAFGGADKVISPLLNTYSNLIIGMYDIAKVLGVLQSGLNGFSDTLVGSATAATALGAALRFAFFSTPWSAAIAAAVLLANELISSLKKTERQVDQYRLAFNLAAEDSIKASNKILTAQNAAFKEPIEAALQRMLKLQAGLNQALNTGIKIPTELDKKLSSIKLDFKLIDADTLETVKIKIEEITRLTQVKDAFIKIKDFDGAKKTFEEILQHAVDINKEIMSAVRGADKEIGDLKNEQADKLLESQLLGKSDKNKIKILSQEAMKLVTEAENEKDLDVANQKLEKAKSIYEQIVNLTKDNKTGKEYLAQIDSVITKQIELQEKLKENLKGNLQDPEKIIKDIGEPLEKQLDLLSRQEVALNKINNVYKEITAQLTELTKKHQEMLLSQSGVNIEAGTALSLVKDQTDTRIINLSKLRFNEDFQNLRKQLENTDINKLLQTGSIEDLTKLKDSITGTIAATPDANIPAVEKKEYLAFLKTSEQLLAQVIKSRESVAQTEAALTNLTSQKDKIIQSFVEAQVPLENALKKYPEIYNSVLNDIKNSLDKVTFNIEDKITELRSLIQQANEASLNGASNPGTAPGFASGGLNPGRDTNTIKASAGEFMVNTQASAKNYSMLSAMNSGFNTSNEGSTINVDTVNLNVSNPVNGTPKQLVNEFRRELRRGTSRLS